ncbi:MAG: sigma-70 family RNA polymerase sigma factor [Pseudomonadota bacterium]
MSTDQLDDRALVRAFQRGDQLALQQLVIRHQDRLFRLARGWLADESMAADATQEVFVRSLNGLTRFRFGAEPFTWFYQTLRNVCRELNRAKPVAESFEQIDPAPGPESWTIATDHMARLRNLVDALPERQREVVYLRIFEGMDVSATARAMRCRAGTVKALLSQARTRLKAQWQ